MEISNSNSSYILPQWKRGRSVVSICPVGWCSLYSSSGYTLQLDTTLRRHWWSFSWRYLCVGSSGIHTGFWRDKTERRKLIKHCTASVPAFNLYWQKRGRNSVPMTVICPILWRLVRDVKQGDIETFLLICALWHTVHIVSCHVVKWITCNTAWSSMSNTKNLSLQVFITGMPMKLLTLKIIYWELL